MKVKIFNSVLILPIPPIFLALAFWWTSISFLPEEYIKYCIIAGLLIGMLIDIFLYKQYLRNKLTSYVLILAYIFYMICTFGFFMGVPAFNILICVPFSLYIYQFHKEYIGRFSVISTVFMLLICITSAVLALMSSSTINDLEGMLNLKGMLNYTILYVIIGVGGLGLIIANFFLAKYAGKLFKKIILKD
jgi:hypothetical protein